MGIHDVVIIGVGPAGLATAIQLRRYGIEPILLEREEIGGLLRNANLVENYLGFPEGISGPEIIELFKKQLNNILVNVHMDEVLELDHKDNVFFVKTNRRTIICRKVVIASGTKPIVLSDINISEGIEDRVLYEIYPIRNAANERIAIVGSGDLAFDYALNLSKENDVMIFNRGEMAKCLPLLQQRSAQNRRISYFKNTSINNIKSQDGKLILICHQRDREWETNVSYLVIAIGRIPNLDFLSESLKENLDRLQNKKLLYQVGDVKNGIYRQTALAAGDGIKAAMEIYQTMTGEDECE